MSEGPWHYISFADPDLPAGTQFLGVAIVRGHGFGGAVLNAHALGCNPGGEAAGMELPSDVPLRPSHCNRLLTAEEAEGAVFPEGEQ